MAKVLLSLSQADPAIGWDDEWLDLNSGSLLVAVDDDDVAAADAAVVAVWARFWLCLALKVKFHKKYKTRLIHQLI